MPETYLGTFKVRQSGLRSYQLTLPKSYCDDLKLGPGDEIQVFRANGRLRLIPKWGMNERADNRSVAASAD